MERVRSELGADIERLKKQRTDPWKDYWGTKQTLEGALRKLGQA